MSLNKAEGKCTKGKVMEQSWQEAQGRFPVAMCYTECANRNTICQLLLMKHLCSGHPVSSSVLPPEVQLLNGAENVLRDQCGIKHLFEQESIML